MSGIKKRTVLAEVTNGGVPYWRFLDWAIVSTGVGAAFEPFIMPGRLAMETNTLASFDFEDMIAMVNEIKVVDANKLPLLLGGDTCHWGYGLPRDGR